ncbi:MAG: RHS repeat-associated core domain-containing protein, partial [Pirellula sp.]
ESITGVMSGYGFTAAGTTYDNEDRLTGFSRAATSGPALLSQSWNLTSVGDWTSVTTNGTAQNRTHGPTHELLTAGGQNVATDVKGNITTLPANLRPAGSTTAMNLTWDSDNKLRSADIDANGTADVNFQYDALGRRVARSGTGGSVVYVQMDQQTIADYPVGGAATTPTFRYVYASYIDEPVVRKTAGTGGTLVYFHRNHQYSVTAVTTSTGNIAERYAYTAYGLPTILDPSGVTLPTSNFSIHTSYTGREWDATLGLHHFRARWMSPNAGRFLGRDPIGFEGSEWGLYEFVDSKPLIDADPFGEFSIAMLGLRQRRTRNAIEVCRRCYMQNGYCVADVSGSTWLESQFRRLLPLPAQTGGWNEIPGSRRFFSRKDWNADCCSSCAELGDVVNSCETFYSEPTKWKNWYPPPPPPRNSGPWA